MDADTAGDVLQLAGATIATIGLTRGAWKSWSTLSEWTRRFRRPEYPSASGPVVARGTDEAKAEDHAIVLKTDVERFSYLSSQINELSRRLAAADAAPAVDFGAQLAELRRDLAAATKWERRAALAGAGLTIAGMALALLC
ncbi:hypothetical protein [Nocardia sp. MW-W600-9]